jgi:DNA-binding response OmpR family regulator
VLVRALENSGYEVDAYDSAAEAVGVFQRCPYGIVLLDCDSPEIDGFGVAATLRLMEGTARRTPIVGLTGNAGQAHRRERKAAGIDNYLLKPFRRDRVESVVSRYAPTRDMGPVSELMALDKDRVRELQELAGGDISLLQELINLFLSSAPEQLDQMRRAAEDEDGATLRRAAHVLKGSSGQMGALRMQEICGMIETLGESGSLVGVDSLLTELSLAFERAVGELRALGTSFAGDGAADAPTAAPKVQAKSNEILLAEDDMLIARFLISSLSAAGFQVTHVPNGHVALESLREKTYGVVVLDVNMPEVDGYQVLAEIRATVGESTKVAIISSRHQEQDVLRAFDLGVDDYLTKPFNPSEVVARVRRLARQGTGRA